MIKYFAFLTILIIISCGKSVEDKDDDGNQEESTPDGIYSAVLIPVNYRISTQIHGDVKIVKFSDDFNVTVKIKGAPRGQLSQHILTGSECPRIELDENKDGYIDSYEVRSKSGHILVPLDGDLSSQERGFNFRLQGNYSYSRSTSYDLMLSDLHLRDEIINDSIVKLRERELYLERKVVMIYANQNTFPPTVQGKEIPVACGILTRVSNRTEPEESEWDVEVPPPEDPRPRRPRTNPRPRPLPDPLPDSEVEPETNNDSWWSRWRSRWDRWRDRVGDWWYNREEE